MGVIDKIQAYNGIAKYLDKFDIGEPDNKRFKSIDAHINGILIMYCMQYNIKHSKNNSPRYKGNFSPVLANAAIIQDNFDHFSKWIRKNYVIKKAK